MGEDAIDESKLVLCCALCCANLSTYPTADCLGCSGKVGLCCLNAEFCCKVSSRSLKPLERFDLESSTLTES